MPVPPGLQAALEYGPDEVAQLGEALFRAKVDAYERTLRDRLAAHGHPDFDLTLAPRLLDALRSEAESHAAKIVATYNAELAAFLTRHADEPTDLLIRHVGEWARARGESWRPIIATTEVYTAHADAQLGFYIDNGVAHLVEWDFGGHGDDPPDCPICKELMALNPWRTDQVVTIGNPHIGCAQEWHPSDVQLPDMVVAGLAPAGIVGQDTLIHRAGGRAQAVAYVQGLR